MQEMKYLINNKKRSISAEDRQEATFTHEELNCKIKKRECVRRIAWKKTT